MQRAALALSVVALAVSFVSLLNGSAGRSARAANGRDSWRSERNYPPLVFSSRAWLDCSISSEKPGRQAMNTVSGQGFSFDAAMLPIKDGRVKLTDPGMNYSFTSFPASAVPAKFTGLGDGRIVEMKTEVEVSVKRFDQPAGPGTSSHFGAADINDDSAYVEFTGVFVRTKDKKRFPFRVLFGSVPTGGGDVMPAGRGPEVPLLSKRVALGSAQLGASVTTALYEAEDDVRSLK